MSADKYPSIFSRQMEDIVHLITNRETLLSVEHINLTDVCKNT